MDRYEPMAPCPHCFESSGYAERVHPHTWDDPAWSDADPTRPCPFCDHTGMVPASEATPDDWDEDFYDPGYLAALDAQSATPSQAA